eukprot:CAMPEP_0171101722 /NCGR_PEP_ID=MMETSP0766_2-20121228/55806_1 /TAXON_ID=439317 /ORGANISM="Gambierdiscus australes, Strain CAWD 149" /LENGTH=114 /DNA_ID=CAMNT_0011561843 /DNA_START=44 /DNA_END=385 /DNA_ORIENTATION=+
MHHQFSPAELPDQPNGIHLSITHDPTSNRILDAKSFDIVPLDRPKLDPEALKDISAKIADVKSINAGIRPLLRQAFRKYLTVAKIPQNLPGLDRNIAQGCAVFLPETALKGFAC